MSPGDVGVVEEPRIWMSDRIVEKLKAIEEKRVLLPGVGVRWPVEDGREFIRCEWFKLLPKDDADEWVMPMIDDVPPSEVTIDCCWCWLSSWSRGGDMGSALILTGAGDDEEGGGVLFDTAKWGIPLQMERDRFNIGRKLTSRTTWYVAGCPSSDANCSKTLSCSSQRMTLKSLVRRMNCSGNYSSPVLEFEGRRRECWETMTIGGYAVRTQESR